MSPYDEHEKIYSDCQEITSELSRSWSAGELADSRNLRKPSRWLIPGIGAGALACHSDLRYIRHHCYIPLFPMTQAAKKPEQHGILAENDLHADPIHQLQRWLRSAEEAKMMEPTAMVLATATPDGKPSARVVLLKSVNGDGLVFFTNYESRKGKELRQNPRAALLFYWDVLLRQVRIEGRVSVLSKAESYEYFRTRPFMSRVSAWASRQSEVLPDREILEKEVRRLENEFEGKEIQLPPFWGGFRLIPSEFEFWQGRESRLHDRFRYSLRKDRWIIERLSP